MTTHDLWSVWAAAALLALSACGGSGDRDEPAAVPDSALNSPEEFSDWVGARATSESHEPLAMNSAMPPTSETAEPVDID